MKKLILAGFIALCFGCATLSDVVVNKKNGTVRTYAVSEADAYKIARKVFQWEGADAVEERKEDHLLLTSSGMGMFTVGTVMGAWIEPVDAQHTTVTVVTKRKIATNAITTLTESTFQSRFAQGLEILKSGHKLPESAP